MDGVEARLTGWKDALRIAKLGGGQDEDWKDERYFVKKLAHNYVRCVDWAWK